MISVAELSAYKIPSQDVPTTVSDGNPVVLEANVQEGSVHVDLAIVKTQLGAFESYGIDIAGLHLAPSTDEPIFDVTAAIDENAEPGVASDPSVLELTVELWSGETFLTGGARMVGKPTSQMKSPASVRQPNVQPGG